MKQWKSLTLAGALALTGGLALAQDAVTTPTQQNRISDRPRDGRGAGRPEGGHLQRINMAQRLESLTEEQKAKLKDLTETSREKANKMREEFSEKMSEIRSTASDPAKRAEALRPIREKQEAFRKEVNDGVDAILTSDQVKEIESRVDSARENLRERFGRDNDSETTGPRRGFNRDRANDDGTTASRRGEGRRGMGPDGEGRRGPRPDGEARRGEGGSRRGPGPDGEGRRRGPRPDVSNDAGTTATANPFSEN